MGQLVWVLAGFWAELAPIFFMQSRVISKAYHKVLMAPIFFGNNLNVLQVGDENAHHNIWVIVQKALFPDTQELFPGK